MQKYIERSFGYDMYFAAKNQGTEARTRRFKNKQHAPATTERQESLLCPRSSAEAAHTFRGTNPRWKFAQEKACHP